MSNRYAALTNLAEAVKAAGELPSVHYTGDGCFQCDQCKAWAYGLDELVHRDDCAGVRVRDALTGAGLE